MELRHLADMALRRRLHHLVLHLGRAGSRGIPTVRYRGLADELGPLLWLDINGNDPFDRPDLPRLVSAFDTEVLTLMSSVAAVERVVEHTRRVRGERVGEVVVALCLDGLRPTHDRLHSPGSWDRVWQAFDQLAPLEDVRVELRTRLCAENAPEALALAEYVWQQGPDAHVVSLPQQPTEDPAPIDLLNQLQGPLFEVLDRYTPGDGRLLTRLRCNYHRLRWTVAVQTLAEGRQVIPCLAGLSHAVVHSNGDVASCDMLPPLGNLSCARWSEIWSGGALQAQREYIGAGGCHCTDECAMHDSIVLRAQNLPRLLGV